jgi:acyl dehydratase
LSDRPRAIDLDSLGRWGGSRSAAVTAESIAAYADAVGSDAPSEPIAPPLYAVVASWPVLLDCVANTLPPELLAGIVHRSQDMLLARPVRAGETLATRARVAGVAGGAGMTTLVVECECGDAAAFTSTIVVVGHGGEPSAGKAPVRLRSRRAGEPVAVVEQEVAKDQAVRYADASGDHNPIHLDDGFARSAGFEGTILHGMCTLAMAAGAVVSSLLAGDPARVRRLAGTFSKPVFPGTTLTTTIWRPDADELAFECTTPGGVAVRDGLAVVS